MIELFNKKAMVFCSNEIAWFLKLFLPQVFLLQPLLVEPKCPDVILCGNILISPEHASQISETAHLGITEDLCLARVYDLNLPDLHAVFCPDLQFCGLGLSPKNTKVLKVSLNLDCNIYASDSDACSDVEKELIQTG